MAWFKYCPRTFSTLLCVENAIKQQQQNRGAKHQMRGRKSLFAVIILLNVVGCTAHHPPPLPPEQIMYPPQSVPPAQPRQPLQPVPQDQVSADVVSAQIATCWNPPAGAALEDSMKIQVKLVVKPDGTIASATIVDDKGLYGHDLLWTALADSALRAIRNPQCHKLNLPPEKYESWKDMTMTFSPR